jgi:phosphoribosyl-AMP cyclohydrolase
VNTAGAAEAIRWPADGLIPAVAQDDRTGAVLMVAYMDRDALAASIESGLVHYYSRSRGRGWLKGESSGNIQRLIDVRVNCDRNSLLLTVRQRGAVCHDGYDSCYYRRLDRDGGLEIVRERAFDPAEVYGAGVDPSLGAAARLLFGAYAYLRDHDLSAESGTSQRLRAPDDEVSSRVADELDELAGAVTGEHLHGTLRESVLLEATQCIYWITLAALRAGEPWVAYRLDLALDGYAADSESRSGLAERLRMLARQWREGTLLADPDRFHETVRLAGAAAASAGIDPIELLDADLGELRTRSYLAPYFADSAP